MKTLRQLWLVRKLGNYFLAVNQWLWNVLPSALVNTRPLRLYGHLLHRLILHRGWRQPNPGTFMLRNRAELDMVHRLVSPLPTGQPLRIAVLACSFGMEVYSIKWALRDLQNEIDIELLGLDIDDEVLAVARSGRYPLSEFSWQFQRLSPEELGQICPIEDDVAVVSERLRSGIHWLRGNACDPGLREQIGQQDIVVANRFLCHMQPQVASACLRTVSRLVRTGGYLFVTGVDLEVRQRVMREMGFLPVTENLEAMHNGDVSLLNGWPWKCWGLEPYDPRRADRVERYATVYRKPAAKTADFSRRAPAVQPEKVLDQIGS